MNPTNCAIGGLTPYIPSAQMPWNSSRVMHLFRRIGFGISVPDMQEVLNKSPIELVDQWIDQSIAAPPAVAPAWANWTIQDYTNYPVQQEEQLVSWMINWAKDMLEKGIREKLVLFWHNHFVTKYKSYSCPSYLYQYHHLLQKYALGNFRQFVYEIGKTPAMLVFLDGVQNTNIKPNENYARELFELFTLGRDNGYTQNDIKEAARALTGFVGYPIPCGPIGYVEVFHDKGQKEIFGKKGTWGYDEVHELLFTERADQIATYICTKIYRHFVHPEPDFGIINGLADTFKQSNWELAPVLRQLFKSEHFFDEEVMASIIKSPADLFIGFLNETGSPYNDELLRLATYAMVDQGQFLFNPVDVAGWPGNRTWINTDTLVGRWQLVGYYLFILLQNDPEKLKALAYQLCGPSEDPAFVAAKISDHFLAKPFHNPSDYAKATQVLKWEVPQNYYDRNLWNLDWETVPAQIAVLLYHLVRLPEFQLN